MGIDKYGARDGCDCLKCERKRRPANYLSNLKQELKNQEYILARAQRTIINLKDEIESLS